MARLSSSTRHITRTAGLGFFRACMVETLPNIGNNNFPLRSLKSPLSVEIFALGDFREKPYRATVEKRTTLCVQRVPLCSKEISRWTGNARPQPRRTNTPHCRRRAAYSRSGSFSHNSVIQESCSSASSAKACIRHSPPKYRTMPARACTWSYVDAGATTTRARILDTSKLDFCARKGFRTEVLFPYFYRGHEPCGAT